MMHYVVTRRREQQGLAQWKRAACMTGLLCGTAYALPTSAAIAQEERLNRTRAADPIGGGENVVPDIVVSARRKDEMALEKVRALDAPGVLETARRNNITMCGAIGAGVMLMAARELGATGARLVEYTHSGQVSGDNDRVVSYAGVVVT